MDQQNRLFMIDDDSHHYITTPARRWALDKGEIFVVYQPTLRRSGDNGWEMSGVEALPRWQHPKRGVLSPDVFMPALEKSGLLAPLSDFVLTESVRQMAAWQQYGLNISVAVNLCPGLLDDSAFADRLITLLDSHHLDYAKLSLQVGEDSVLHGSACVLNSLGHLRDEGFGVAIDCFGTGYVSLSQLHHRLPFNELKIDASLVQNIRASNAARVTIHAIIFLAHKLGMSVCADGVETEYAFSFLSDADCDKLQGLLVSPAISAAKLQNQVQEWCSADPIGAGGKGSSSGAM
ncbi:MAG: EAL domain-containing protein [Pseudomonadales bacterium]